MLQVALIIAAFTAFIVLLIEKVGLREYFTEQITIGIIPKMFACDFCLSFWISLAICLGLFMKSDNLTYLIIPFISTPIARMLL